MQSANKRLIDGWSSGFVGALNSGLDGIGKLISLASRSHSSESRFNSASVVSGRVHWPQAVRSRAATMVRRRIGFFDSRSEGLFVKRIGNRWRSGRPGLSLFQCSTIATALIATVQIKGPSAPSISWMALREAISVIMPKNPATPPQIKSTIASMISPPSFASIFQQKTATVLAPYREEGNRFHSAFGAERPKNSIGPCNEPCERTYRCNPSAVGSMSARGVAPRTEKPRSIRPSARKWSSSRSIR